MGMSEDDKRNCCLVEIQETEAKYYKTLEDIEKVSLTICTHSYLGFAFVTFSLLGCHDVGWLPESICQLLAYSLGCTNVTGVDRFSYYWLSPRAGHLRLTPVGIKHRPTHGSMLVCKNVCKITSFKSLKWIYNYAFQFASLAAMIVGWLEGDVKEPQSLMHSSLFQCDNKPLLISVLLAHHFLRWQILFTIWWRAPNHPLC